MAFDRGKNKATMKAYLLPGLLAQVLTQYQRSFLLFSTAFAQGQSWQWGNSGGADDNAKLPVANELTSMCTARWQFLLYLPRLVGLTFELQEIPAHLRPSWAQ
jgi:hypothetical protein